MSTSGVSLTEGGNFIANIAMTANQFCAVKQTTTPRALTLASTGGEAITGILQNTPSAGDSVEVCQAGNCKAKAGVAGFTAGDQLMTEATTGCLVTKTSTNTVVAVARETCTSGQIGLVTVVPTAG